MGGKKVVVGMSGGVDSSVTAHLLKKQGYYVIGLHLRMHAPQNCVGTCGATEICAGSCECVRDVKSVCETLGIPYHIIDCTKEFNARVFKRTVDEFAHGKTPNPCCFCNPDLKFKTLIDFADKIGAQFVATGHYSRVEHVAERGYMAEETRSATTCHTRLLRAVDDNKDQSYFLSGLSRAQLARVIFPLGQLRKPEVRKIAGELGLVTAQKKDSTDICFELPKHGATIGQRACVGGAKERMYHIGEGKVGGNDSPELYTKELVATNFNWHGPRRIAIIGPQGSGKSTLAVKLGERLGLPVYHTDMFVLKPNWQIADKAVSAKQINAIADGKEWIIDGNNSATMGYRFDRADLIIFLNLSVDDCISAAKQRYKSKRIGVPEYLDTGIERCEELVDIIKRHWGGGASEQIKKLLVEHKNKVVELNSREQIDKYLPCVTAKIRYRQADQDCAVTASGKGVRVAFKVPQRAVAVGQWVVLYDGDVVLGGGEITEVLK